MASPSLILKSLIHFEFIFMYSKVVVQFHPFACGCPVFSMPFIEQTVFSPSCILSSFVVN